ncbi:MAG: hypothetical protein P8049_01815 [Gemmatimonadota bacterium]|jgi:hypothetical protein
MVTERSRAGEGQVELSREGRFLLALAIAWLGTGPTGRVEHASGTRIEVGCQVETVEQFVPVVTWHANRYEALEVRDTYKLLHQAVAGPGHAIRDREIARAWLAREWNSLGPPREAEPLFEPLSADGRLVRLNLRPWRAAGRGPEEVLEAFLQTAEAVSPSAAKIRAEMEAIHACSSTLAASAGIEAKALDAFFADQAAAGYPAVHHSAGYSSAYAPAYRVVLRTLVK